MKPILFNTDMVRAILDGRKTVTRRVVKNAPKRDDLKPYETLAGYGLIAPNSRVFHLKPPYRPNDILYVREAFQQNYDSSYSYRAGHKFEKEGGWRPSIHMPREAARLFLRVTGVRVERLQDITPTGIILEGVLTPPEKLFSIGKAFDRMREVWDSTIKPADLAIYGWDANPYVWCVEFEKISKEEAYRQRVSM